MSYYFKNISQYTIIDLPACLKLSEKYLKKILEPDLFKKIRFIDATKNNLFSRGKVDLFINIDSLAERDNDVAKNYLSFINQKGNYCLQLVLYHLALGIIRLKLLSAILEFF